MEDRVKMMDKLAASYAARGRKIEFSNAAVSGQVWNSDASMEEKLALLAKAQSAHGHSRYSDFDSIDYYIPSTGETRFGKSAEGAEIIVPTLEGGKVNYGQGGGYGAYVTVTDEKGNVLVKTGHGDVRGAKSGSVSINAPKPSINKDTAVEPDPLEDNIQPEAKPFNLPSMVQEVVKYIPMPIPMLRNNQASASNTPAWGNPSIVGG